MRKHLAAAAILSALAVPAFAGNWPAPESWQVAQRIELKDGTYLNIYKDGKSAMENRFGQSVSMQPGHSMQSKDGRTMNMAGNETTRVELQNPFTLGTSN